VNMMKDIDIDGISTVILTPRQICRIKLLKKKCLTYITIKARVFSVYATLISYICVLKDGRMTETYSAVK
jgi:hypothetical protein